MDDRTWPTRIQNIVQAQQKFFSPSSRSSSAAAAVAAVDDDRVASSSSDVGSSPIVGAAGFAVVGDCGDRLPANGFFVPGRAFEIRIQHFGYPGIKRDLFTF